MSLPKILMLDEPSLGLAPLMVAEVFETTVKVSREGVTILLVEQNVRQSLKMAHRAYVLENGRIVMEGLGRGFDGGQTREGGVPGIVGSARRTEMAEGSRQ